jgi:hypothetical protein
MAAFLLCDLGFMDIFKAEHVPQALLFVIVEAAACGELFRVLISTEEHVPPDDVAIVIAVLRVFVVIRCISGRWKM